MAVRISIVIANWNGEAFLARCLASTMQSAADYGLEHEIVVVDDASSDRSPGICEQRFPNVRLLRNPQNMGFGATCNRGAAEAQGDLLVLLNNDLVPREAMIAELVRPLLEDEGLFGVTGKTVNWHDEQPNHVNMAGKWLNGAITPVHWDTPEPTSTMFLQGGSCAVRRAEFLRLGGFCPLFHPGYWEDYDISYLAMKAGWRNLYNPKACAWHIGQASMGRAYDGGYIGIVRQRNFHIFQWLNLTDPDLLRGHLFGLPSAVAASLGSAGDGRQRVRGFVRALKFTKAIRVERERRMALLRHTDREVLAPFRNHGEQGHHG